MPSRAVTHSGQANAQRLIAEHTDRLVELLIHEGKITKPNWWVSQRGRFGIFVVVLALCAITSLGYQWWLLTQADPSSLPNGAQIATALIAAAAGIFAYYQWTDTRRETSLEKFYDRLSLVNERYFEWKDARQLVGHFWGPSSDDGEFYKRMYVYLELDNLEYMIFRYQLGFVRKPLFRRAVRTFGSRCESEAFCLLAVELVNGAGYDAKTIEIVNVLVAQAERR
jgi:hypothetical protein